MLAAFSELSCLSVPMAEEPALSVRTIFHDHAEYVWRSLRYLGVPESDLPDAVQEVFLVVHRRLSDFEGRSSVRTWLYGISIRVAHGMRRKAHVQREQVTAEPPDTSVPPSQTDQLALKDARTTLNHILSGLDEAKRVVFVLYEIERLTLREISESLGVPQQTVYSRLKNARRDVKHAVERFASRASESPALAARGGRS